MVSWFSIPVRAVFSIVIAWLAVSGPARSDPAPSRRLPFLDRVIAAHPLKGADPKERVGEIRGLTGDQPCYLRVSREALCPAGWDCAYISSMARHGDMYDRMLSLMDPDGNDVAYSISVRLRESVYESTNFDPFDGSEVMKKDADMIYTSVYGTPHVEGGKVTIVEQTMSGLGANIPVGTVRAFQLQLNDAGDITAVTAQVVTKLRKKVKFEIKGSFEP